MKSLSILVLCTMMTVAFWMGFGFHNSFAQESAGKLPADIHADSLSRMPRPHLEDMMTDEDKESFKRVLSWEKILNDPSGELGPTGTRAWIPQLAEEYRKLGTMVHKANTMEPKYVELVACVAVRETDNPEEWFGHAATCTKLLGAKTVEVVQKEEPVSLLEDQKAAAMIQFGRELFHQRRVSSKTFANMEQQFGRRDTLDVTLLMGYYDQNDVMYRAYDQHNEKAEADRPWPEGK